MKYLILFPLIVIAGCGPVPVAKPTPPVEPVAVPGTQPTAKSVDDGLTDAATLVKWKDDPVAFVGKTLKVRALYYNPYDNRKFPDNPLKNHWHTDGNSPFQMVVTHNGVEVPFKFTVNIKSMNLQSIPNALPGETLVIEFETHQHHEIKEVFMYKSVSISR